MKYFNYTKIGAPTTATDIPYTPNMLWEIDASAGKLLVVLAGEEDDVQSSEDKGITWTVEVSGTGGAVFFESWHDRSNELIYLIQSDAVNDSETYVVDYSNWAAITITKHNGDLGVAIQSVYRNDIFLRDGNLEVILCTGLQVEALRYNNPWVSIDVNGDNVNTVGCVVVVGTVAYFYGDINGANTIGMYSFNGAVVATLDTIAATSFPTAPAGATLAAAKNMAYDGDDTIYFIAKDDGTGDNYLYSYGITADTITKRGLASYYLMRDRDTAAGVKEKAWDFNVNGFSVYQLHDVIKYQPYKIARPAITADYKIHALTDNFLWASKLNGAWASEIWEYEDQLSLVRSLIIDHQVEEASHAYFTLLKDDIIIEKNMLIRFYHEYTTAGSTSEEIIFEGTVFNFTDTPNQIVWCVSPAKKEIKNTKPSGDYTVDSDGLISGVIADFHFYITVGTLSDGADLGTVSLGGNKNSEIIFDDCSEFEAWIWYLAPTGPLYFNNGTVDCTINYTEASELINVKPSHIHDEFNRIKVKGAYVDGVQIESAWQENIESQQRVGINEKEIDIQ